MEFLFLEYPVNISPISTSFDHLQHYNHKMKINDNISNGDKLANLYLCYKLYFIMYPIDK